MIKGRMKGHLLIHGNKNPDVNLGGKREKREKNRGIHFASNLTYSDICMPLSESPITLTAYFT